MMEISVGMLRMSETSELRLTRRAMLALIGDIARPRLLAFQFRPTGEGAAGDDVIADAALVFALGARPIRRAGPSGSPPNTPASPNLTVPTDLHIFSADLDAIGTQLERAFSNDPDLEGVAEAGATPPHGSP